MGKQRKGRFNFIKNKNPARGICINRKNLDENVLIERKSYL
jgi:hypothetical protein